MTLNNSLKLGSREASFLLFAGCVISSFLVYSDAFHQLFYFPKAMAFHAAGITALVLLMVSHRIKVLPTKASLTIALFLLGMGVMALSRQSPRSEASFVLYWLSSALIFLGAGNISLRERPLLLKAFFFLALAEAILSLCQFFGFGWPYGMSFEKPIGTVGNTEFLATLLGVGVLLGAYLCEAEPEKKRFWVGGMLLILAGVVAIKSKGTLAFLSVVGLWFAAGRRPWIVIAAIATLSLSAFYFPASVKGRLFLWLTSMVIFRDHFLTGVGHGQFENTYLNAAHDLLQRFPGFQASFGSHTATVMDAHNIYLHSAAEGGVLELIFVVLATVYITIHIKRANHWLLLAMAFLFFKSLYTVMFHSFTSWILFLCLLGITWPENQWRAMTVDRRFVWGLPLFVGVIVLCLAPPAISDARYKQGLHALMVGKKDESLRLFQEAVRLDGENSSAHLGIAHIHFLRGDDQSMDREIMETVRLKKTMNTLKISAHMYFYRGLLDKALPIYTFLSEVFPEHMTSRTKLASIYFQRGENEKALKMAQNALSLEPRIQSESDNENRQICYKIIEGVNQRLSLKIQG